MWDAVTRTQAAYDESLVDRLAVCLRACRGAGIDVDEARLDGYADALTDVARIDVASVPDDPAAAVRQVVLGTALVDPLLITLRRPANSTNP